jgi:AbrB family looped-hinge helix DNA binding protein
MEPLMPTTMTIKGQVTIPKQVRQSLGLTPGDSVEFAVNPAGQIVVHKAGSPAPSQAVDGKRDRFAAARGKAQVKWRTDELMALLRAD